MACSAAWPARWRAAWQAALNLSIDPNCASIAAASAGDVRTESVKRELTKPGCRGECPRIVIDSVAFPGIAPLTQAVDRGLAGMTGVDANLQGNYRTIDEYVAYFWRTAQPRDRTDLQAKLRDTVGDLIGVAALFAFLILLTFIVGVLE